MKQLIAVLLISYAAVATASQPSAFEKMMAVNKEWANNPDGVTLLQQKPVPVFADYTAQITFHLQMVGQTLRKRACRQFSPSQLANRKKLLDELDRYSAAAVYPVNDYLTYQNPVFIDKKNTHCAVGYLMLKSGYGRLAKEIDKKQKYAFVHAISVDGVKDWAVAHGFTISELAWIQPAYPVNITVQQLENGLDGDVLCTAIDSINQTIYAAGLFQKSGTGTVCNNIAVYKNAIWQPLASGVNGKVNAILLHQKKLYVGGKFTVAGGIAAQNIAMYDLLSMQWSDLGSLNDEVKTLAVYNNQIYAGGKFSDMLARWSVNQWLPVNNGFLIGNEVKTLEVVDSLLYIGGDFELATGAIRRNVATYDGTFLGISGMGTQSPVNDFAVFKNRLYASCDYNTAADTCTLALFDGFDWKCILKTRELEFNGTIKTLHSGANSLYVGGDFYQLIGMLSGSNIAKVNVIDSSGLLRNIMPIGSSDSAVHNIFIWQGKLGVAGKFNYLGSSLTNQIALISSENTAIEETDPEDAKISVFPNPAQDVVHVLYDKEIEKDIASVKLLDHLGQTVFVSDNKTEFSRINLTQIHNSGIYFLCFQKENGLTVAAKRIVIAK